MDLTVKQIKDLDNMNVAAQKAKLGAKLQELVSSIEGIGIVLDDINGESIWI